MTISLDPRKLLGPSLDAAGALVLFGARSYCLWVLWSLYVAEHLPFGLHPVDLPVVAAAVALVAAWRGLSLPAGGSAVTALRSAALYASVGLAASWWRGEAPALPELPALEAPTPEEGAP